MKHRVLFADDQLPSPIGAENEQTRSEIRRELVDMPGINDIDAAFNEDFRWFQNLLDYLQKTKHVSVIPVRSFEEAKRKIENPDDFDIAIIDLSWTGDVGLKPGRQHRHNVGLELIDKIAHHHRTIPTIAFSQNFKDDFELMSTVLEKGALPIPKSYDDLGHRAIYSAITYLAALHPVGKIRLFVSHAHDDMDIASQLVTAIELAMDVPDGAIRCTSVPGYKLDLGSMAADELRRELVSARCVIALLTSNSVASQWVNFELGATWLQAKQLIPLRGPSLKDDKIPGPIRGASDGQLIDASTLHQFLDQLEDALGWPAKNKRAAKALLSQLASDMAAGKK